MLLIENRFQLLFALLAAFCFACTKDQDKLSEKVFERDDLKNPIGLKGVKYCDSTLIRPHRLLVKNNYLIVADQGNTFALQIFDAESNRHLSSKGVIGDGLNEIKDVWLIDRGLENNSFWVYSGIEKSMLKFDLVDTSKLVISKLIHEENYYNMNVGLVWATDSTLMAIMANGDNRYVEFNMDGTKNNQFGSWRDINKEFSNYILGDLFQGKLIADPNNNLFVKACIFSDRIEILNINDQSITSIRGPLSIEPKFKITGAGLNERLLISPDNPYGYIDICLDNQYIYALYSGYSQNDFTRGNIKDSSIILKFDRLGNLISNYATDISISSIAVSEKFQKMYGIPLNNSDGCFVVFDF